MKRISCLILLFALIINLFSFGVSAADITASVGAAELISSLFTAFGWLPALDPVTQSPTQDYLDSVYNVKAGLGWGDTVDIYKQNGKFYVPTEIIQKVYNTATVDYGLFKKAKAGNCTSTKRLVYMCNGGSVTFSCRDGTEYIYIYPYINSAGSKCFMEVYPSSGTNALVTDPSGSGSGRTYISQSNIKGTGFRYCVIYSPAVDWTSNIFTEDTRSHSVIAQEIASGKLSETLAPGFVAGTTIGTKDDSVVDGYPIWGSNAIQISTGEKDENGDDKPPVEGLPVGIVSGLGQIGDKTQEDVWDGVSEFIEKVPATLDTISKSISDLFSKVGVIADAVVTWFTETAIDIYNGILGGISAIKDAAVSIYTWLTETAVNFYNTIIGGITTVGDWLRQIWETLAGVATDVITGVQEAIAALFVPDPDAIAVAVDAVKSRFPFFDSIVATGEVLKSSISSGEPPKVYAHLENAEGKFSYGGTVAVLDMSFYSRYKATGDAIISAILFAFFVWRIFVKLPSIISGYSGDVQTFVEIDDKLNGRGGKH